LLSSLQRCFAAAAAAAACSSGTRSQEPSWSLEADSHTMASSSSPSPPRGLLLLLRLQAEKRSMARRACCSLHCCCCCCCCCCAERDRCLSWCANSGQRVRTSAAACHGEGTEGTRQQVQRRRQLSAQFSGSDMK
ncbi:unnamed protein product, partial [Ectocarpus fasciculatus]